MVALNGSGRAPMALTIERLQALGVTSLAEGGAHAVTVPGALAGWAALLERTARGAWTSSCSPRSAAPRTASSSPRAWRGIGSGAARPWKQPWRARLLSAGRPTPRAGQDDPVSDLGADLGRIARDGHRAFYEGDLARALVAALGEHGGLHTEADFAAAAAEWVTPIHSTYGVEIEAATGPSPTSPRRRSHRNRPAA